MLGINFCSVQLLAIELLELRNGLLPPFIKEIFVENAKNNL